MPATVSSSRIVPSSHAFAVDPAASVGLSLAVKGGYLLGGTAWQSVPNANVPLVDNATNYVEVSPVGMITSNTTAFTSGAIFLYIVGTANGVVLSIADWRANPAIPAPNGVDVLKATVTLTDDQIKALPTTPVQIVPAPGSGKMIVPIWGIFSCDARTAPYSNFHDTATIHDNQFASSVYFALDAANFFNDATGPVVAGYSDGSDGLLKLQSVNIAIVNGVSGGLLAIPSLSPAYDLGVATDASNGYENTDLSVVGQNNGLGNFQGGNPANSMKATIAYVIADI